MTRLSHSNTLVTAYIVCQQWAALVWGGVKFSKMRNTYIVQSTVYPSNTWSGPSESVFIANKIS